VHAAQSGYGSSKYNSLVSRYHTHIVIAQCNKGIGFLFSNTCTGWNAARDCWSTLV